MARGGEIKIPMAVDTSGIAKEIDNGLVEPLEDAEKALEALSKVDAGKDLERDLEKAQDATDDLADELDDARDQLKKLGHAAKDAGDDAKRGMDGASEGAENFKEEAASSAKEAAASFSGSADDITDLFQEVSAQAFAGFGPAGAAAGLLLAAGIGIATAEFQKAEEAAEELRQKAVQYAQDALDAGISTETWIKGADRIIERIQELEEEKSTDWRWFWEDDPSQLEEWSDALKELGREGSEVEDVLRGSTDTIKDYKDGVQDARDSVQEQYDAINRLGRAASSAQREEKQRLGEQLENYDDVLKYINQEIDLRKEAGESAQRQSEAGIDAAVAQAEAEEEKAQRIESAQQQVQDSVTGAYDSMRSSATEFATTEDGALNIERWLEYTQEHAAAVATYQSNLQSMKLSPEQWSNLMEMPEDARMQWVAQFVALPENAKAPYAAALNDLGSSGGSEAAVGFDDSFNPDADVEIQVDTSEAESALSNVSKKRTAEINVKTTGKAEAKKDLDALAKKRHATIQVSADTSRANNTVENWRRNQRNRVLYIEVRAKAGGGQLV